MNTTRHRVIRLLIVWLSDDFDFIMRDELVEEGVITLCDRELVQYAKTAEQAWHLILESCTINGNNHSNKKQATL